MKSESKKFDSELKKRNVMNRYRFWDEEKSLELDIFKLI